MQDYNRPTRPLNTNMCMMVLGMIALFSLHVCGPSLLQHSRQQLCSSLVFTTTTACFCAVQAVLQTALNLCGSQKSQ